MDDDALDAIGAGEQKFCMMFGFAAKVGTELHYRTTRCNGFTKGWHVSSCKSMGWHFVIFVRMGKTQVTVEVYEVENGKPETSGCSRSFYPADESNPGSRFHLDIKEYAYSMRSFRQRWLYRDRVLHQSDRTFHVKSTGPHTVTAA